MKTRNFDSAIESLSVFALTSEEMTSVRGGSEDGGPTIPSTPPIKI
ncbi:MAG: hypothetical protein U0X39_01880 [Bacteroidales bacterium]